MLKRVKSTFTGGTAIPKHANRSREAQGLKEQSVISKVYRNRYCKHGQVDLSTQNMKAVLNDLANKQAATEAGSKRMRRKFNETQNLTSIRLLAALQERLVDEEQSLEFSYVGTNTREIKTFKAIKLAVVAQVATKLGPNYLNDERKSCAIAHFMQFYAMMGIEAPHFVGLDDSGTTRFCSKCVFNAGKVLQKIVNSEGNIAVKELNSIRTNKPKLNTEARAEAREAKVGHVINMEEALRNIMDGKDVAYETVMTADGFTGAMSEAGPNTAPGPSMSTQEGKNAGRSKKTQKKMTAKERKEEEKKQLAALLARGFG